MLKGISGFTESKNLNSRRRFTRWPVSMKIEEDAYIDINSCFA